MKKVSAALAIASTASAWTVHPSSASAWTVHPQTHVRLHAPASGLAAPPVALPRVLRSRDIRLVVEEASEAPPQQTPPPPKAAARKPAPTGLFAPLVVGAKQAMGTKELNALRADVIAKHTKVISAFVDTSESQFGQLVLRRMFEAADKDNNGTLDREEIRDALHALGFTFVKDKQIAQIMGRADVDDNEVIDFEEFVTETPRTLRTNLVKLAKQNGHDLGFLA